MRRLVIFAAAVAAAAAAPAASAVACYTLLDRNDQLLYQNAQPPVDMSDRGAALREGLRRRKEYLLIADVDHCPPVAAVAGSAGYRPATVDEIVGGMRDYLGMANARGVMGGGSTADANAGAAPPAGAAPGGPSGTPASN